MFFNTASCVPFLLILWPVVIFSLPAGSPPSSASTSRERRETVYFQTTLTMKELTTGNRSICPFTEKNTTTGGIPKIVTEYSCVLPKDNNVAVARCMKNYACYQGTTTVLIQMPNITEPIPVTVNSGCFCAKSEPKFPNQKAPPSITN